MGSEGLVNTRDFQITIFIGALIFSVLLSLVLLSLGLALSFKHKLDREKLSPFECGFTPKSGSRVPLSLRFFLIAIVFLIFDVELVLIFPVALAQQAGRVLFASGVLRIFIIILIAGLYYELRQGRLN